MANAKIPEKRKYTSITIPTRLYENLEERIKGTGFSSVSDYVTYILRETTAEMEDRKVVKSGKGSPVLDKLRALGYLE